ncbi:hypothetical protein EVAR_67334_1 [Eumeta japonica]|uniref:Uncharacterized protein n=1 Tax=Eumeta variegata TaxID=151549 RepID=A0A4C2AAP2_EUMVA|nr:hypothetical protein EVAR_67334_1 [Eumeta japonica]
MDCNDDFSPGRLNHERSQFEQSLINDGEDTENCLTERFWRPLNGLRQQSVYNCQEHQFSEHNIEGSYYHNNEKMQTVPLSNFGDNLSTNKQNMDEVEQPAELKRHCTKILQQLAEYFLNELDFTFGLLGQFIEDIEACRDDMLSEENSLLAKQQTEIRVGAFIGAFLSIVKALTFKGVNLNEFGNAASILRNAKGSD